MQLDQKLADGTLHYVKGVVAFVRGLGEYALDNHAAAETDFEAAVREFSSVAVIPGYATDRTEVLYLMLGNAIGRAGRDRSAEAAAHFRRALAENPSFARAELGLAESFRAATRCRPHAPSHSLTQALTWTTAPHLLSQMTSTRTPARCWR